MYKINFASRKQVLDKLLIAAFVVFALLLISVVFSSGVMESIAHNVSAPSAPIIVYPTSSTQTVSSKPVVKGLVENGTVVDVYIDGVFNGRADVTNDLSGTANFVYTPFLNLEPGLHIVYAVARKGEKGVVLRSEQSRSTAFAVVPKPLKGENLELMTFTVVPAAPTLVSPKQDDSFVNLKPLITGLTNFDTSVAVYVDGVYNGDAVVKHNAYGTSSFYYKPFLNLNAGRHMVYAVSYNNITKYRSNVSNPIFFNVVRHYVAPTLLEPVVENTILERPYFVGVAKNDSVVKVYVDKVYSGEVAVVNSVSGTGSFFYRPDVNLAPGSHLIYATALSQEGSESPWSNLMSYNVPALAVEAGEAGEGEASNPSSQESSSSESGWENEEDQEYEEVKESKGEEREEGKEGEESEEGEETKEGEESEEGEETKEGEEGEESEEGEEGEESEEGEEVASEEGEEDETTNKKKNVIIGLVIILIIILIFLIRDFIKPRDLDDEFDDEDNL